MIPRARQRDASWSAFETFPSWDTFILANGSPRRFRVKYYYTAADGFPWGLVEISGPTGLGELALDGTGWQTYFAFPLTFLQDHAGDLREERAGDPREIRP